MVDREPAPDEHVDRIFGEEPPIDENDEAHPAVEAAGTLGIYLALASAVIAPISMIGMYFGVQPYANIGVMTAILGVMTAMVLSMGAGAYHADAPY